MKRVKVLFLAANPVTTDRLRLDEEIREITEKVRAAEYRDALELISAWAVRPDDILQTLNMHKPQVVHFSGHGNPSGEIILEGRNGFPQAVNAKALKAVFTVLKENIRVVVLNACYSRVQAEAITEAIDCVVGMNDTIGDQAAIIFAGSFYRAIGFGRSIQEAYDQGKAALLLEGIPEEDTPELLLRKGVNPSFITLLDSKAVQELRKEFENETAYAQQLALNQPRYWEYLLQAELLRSRLIIFNQRLNDFRRGLAYKNMTFLKNEDFFNWVQLKTKDITTLVEMLSKVMNEEIPASVGPPGVAGDPLDIKYATDRLISICYGLLEWEMDIHFSVAPAPYAELKYIMEGWTAEIYEEIECIPEKIFKPFRNPNPQGVIDVRITLNAPKGMDQFNAELKKIHRNINRS